MINHSDVPSPPADNANIAHLWNHPQLTIAIFGLQAHTPERYSLYDAAGIPKQMEETLSHVEGLLCLVLP